jgi:hypothetical protein
VKIVFAPLALALLLNLAPTSQTVKAEARATKRAVRIYLGCKCEDSKDSNYCITPVLRAVDRRAPALGALKAFLSGPTEAEKSQDLYALYTEYLSIKRLAITKGTARVSLRTTCEVGSRWPGDMAPETFSVAIEKTLKQFPNVRRVMICLDGYADFASERGGPRKRCN